MVRYLIMMGMVSAAAIVWADFVTQDPETAAIATTPAAQSRSAPDRASEPNQPVRLSGVERLRADGRGHHIASFGINGTRVQGLVDTGATAVAISQTVARRAGIALHQGDFVIPIQTANGTTRAARVVIDDVTLGSIRVRDVEAFVLDDDALDIALIGMSFLGRLREFSHENGTLVLRR